ncbi:hypothetical protein AAFF_G00123680 [Aldrovandia affinis]|uniref:tRNA-splicing endonuclease subunit Sen54 N-terminal domain-containing protein n=1 Tax=Aldrovandia affinis TaxID=143900 RepID=A0AAD7RRV6_9TELE|nr:hypothetical protein AAFF_G00123680 [Aldrovandia affinis]
MADSGQTRKDVDLALCCELLSPSELFAARSRSHKIPVRGQKDFIPDGSEPQQERLEHSLEEHWNLLSEERVERLGNLVKAVWIPVEGVVKLQSPAGKFWQTMGFSEHGKQFLLPEEALYLMECGNVQVFYHDLPLSIQEGYEHFLSPGTVSLQQYQVFGHLKRLGYVVTRFNEGSGAQSLYEQQLNLPQVSDRPGRHLKRKRSLSSASRQTDGQEGQAGEKMDLEQEGEVEDPRPGSSVDPVSPHPLEEEEEDEEEEEERPEVCDPTGMESSADSAPGRSWWTEQKAECEPRPTPWPPPTPHSCPGLSVGPCDVTPWLRELNKREEHSSRRDRERERDRARYRRAVNKDREVRRCRNWSEYRRLLERRTQHSHRDRPAHLWEGEVKPLLQPGQCTSTRDLMDTIGVIQSSHLLEGVSRLGQVPEGWSIRFNVYQPDTVAEFRKTSPGKPYSRMCVCSFDGPVPDLRVLKLLALQSGDVPVTFAVVDHGDISFYTFKGFRLPTDYSH